MPLNKILDNYSLFTDCQSLFLRQSSTGKCIKPGNGLVYNSEKYALPYWAVMTDDCLQVKAQFSFDGEDLKNINTKGTLAWFRETSYKSQLAVYTGVSKTAIKVQNRTDHHLKQTNDGSLRFYNKKECALPTATYVKRTKTCNTADQNITFGE